FASACLDPSHHVAHEAMSLRADRDRVPLGVLPEHEPSLVDVVAQALRPVCRAKFHRSPTSRPWIGSGPTPTLAVAIKATSRNGGHRVQVHENYLAGDPAGLAPRRRLVGGSGCAAHPVSRPAAAAGPWAGRHA